jgi:phosphatidylserine decarboxylase
MDFVSSVNITVGEGTKLSKGDEIGFFAYGGSDIIMLFEPNAVKFTAFANRALPGGRKNRKDLVLKPLTIVP